MCRLFGLSAGTQRVHATFWLLDAPDSLELQGRRNSDGTGLGFFDEVGAAVVDKQPEPAYSDVEFITEAKVAESTTFVAHVRKATVGELKLENTHPFSADGMIMAHNGGFEDLRRLEAELGAHLSLVGGDTDSERYFALIARNVLRNGGDVGAAIVEAAQWIADNLPLFALNLVLTTEHELWALRYPEHHRLYALVRPAGGHDDAGELDVRSTTLGVSSPHLTHHPAVVVASEPLDESPHWRLLAPGELLHVSPSLQVSSRLALTEPPSVTSVDPLPYVP
jgi:predicted glutamine amidotransferase